MHIVFDRRHALSTHLLEYSLSIVAIVSIGHLSTVALAAATLGTMTATVTGHSIIQGLASTLDTMLPSAWTSPQPQLVGLWSHRMGQYTSPPTFIDADVSFDLSMLAVVMTAFLIVCSVWSIHLGALLTFPSASRFSFFGSTQSQYCYFCTKNLMSLTSPLFISSMHLLVFPPIPSIVSPGTS